MKFVKRTFVFLVLCLAAYGAFTLLKRTPDPNLNDKDIEYLQSIGIPIQDGKAAESGLSATLGVDGMEPIGSGLTAPSSAPPSFMLGAPDSTVATPFADPVPQVASSYPDQSASEPFAPATDVPPPPDLPAPVDPPIQTVPPVEPPSLEEVSSVEPPPVLPPESPPPRKENWDGPASDLTRMLPPSEFLVPHDPHPTPVADTPRNIPLPFEENTFYQTSARNVQRIDSNVRSVVLMSAPREETKEDPFSSSDSVPINFVPVQSVPVHPVQVHPAPIQSNPIQFSSAQSVPLQYAPVQSIPARTAPVQSVSVQPAPVHPVPVQSAPVRYTPPPARQSLRFEPVKPESPPNTPSVAFAPPKRTTRPPQTEQTIPQQATPLVATNTAVKQIGTPRIIESTESPFTEQPSIQDARKQFIQLQQQLAESGNPQNIRLAFIQLSKLYEHKLLSEAERTMMLPILDSLALTVIYARDTHILEAPYRVKPGETVESIAQDFNLTPAFLRKVNKLSMPHAPVAGTTLKVVEGQFDARISVERNEMTLLLGGLYAGRVSFTLSPVGIPVQRGEFYITHRTDRTLVLNNDWILATAQVRDATIVFADQDANELFDILSEQSVIVVE